MPTNPTRPAIPKLLHRPTVIPTYSRVGLATGHRTLVPRAASARTREAIRTDVVRLRGTR